MCQLNMNVLMKTLQLRKLKNTKLIEYDYHKQVYKITNDCLLNSRQLLYLMISLRHILS